MWGSHLKKIDHIAKHASDFVLRLHATPALAIPETWVASNGGGVACTSAAPCANFQTAHLATDPGGIIKCVDAGNFGTVGITKSITIDCTGTNGGIVSVPVRRSAPR